MNWNPWENCQKYALKSNCSDMLFWARIGRLDILWSLARSITKWTRVCDKRLNRLDILHTCGYKQYCYVGNTANYCRLGLFQDSDFAGDLEDSKSTSGGTLCVSGSHTFVPIRTAVSHSSQDSEVICLDAGLRLDGTRFMGSECFSPWEHNSEPW